MGFFKNIYQALNADRKDKEQFQDSEGGVTMGLFVFLVILFFFVFLGLVYMIFLSFSYCFKCNHNNDKQTMEFIMLLLGLFLFPLINIIYVLWKPNNCSRKPNTPPINVT